MLQAVIEAIDAVARDEIVPRHLNSRRERKADGSLVTEADRAASTALIAALARIAPHPVVSEEMAQEEQRALWRSGDGTLWCIDPLDGTSNFASGITQFAVSVALLRDGRPALGVIHAPLLGETFSACAGAGARLNGAPIRLRQPAARLRDAIAGIDFKRLDARLATRLATTPPYHSQRNFGSSALELAYTASGRYDVYIHGAQKLWDYAAGALLVEESGGVLAAIDGADFWSQDPWQRSVLAASTPALLDLWRSWIAAARSP